jgi:hypothetical protein
MEGPNLGWKILESKSVSLTVELGDLRVVERYYPVWKI